MKVLIATKQGFDENKKDFFWTNENELVIFPTSTYECCNRISCGCNRSFNGIETRRGTTIAKVTDIPELMPSALINQIFQSNEQYGWNNVFSSSSLKEATKLYNLIIKTCENLDVGVLISRKGRKISIRNNVI